MNRYGTQSGNAADADSDAPRTAAGGEGEHAACDVCGGPKQVQVLRGYRNGAPIFSSYCIRCAPEGHVPLRADGGARTRLRLTTLMCLAGAILVIAGGLGDMVFPAATAGFGAYQRLGIVVSAVLILYAVLLRADIIAMVGLFLFGGALLADWAGMMQSPGVGWKQQAALAIGGALFAGAIISRWIAGRTRRRSRFDRKLA